MTSNIAYETSHLADYFSAHRRRWDEFYPSERWVFERIGATKSGFGRVLDVGCAIGGLGNALTEKFPLTSYIGVDINAQAIDIAQEQTRLSIPSKFVCADIVTCSEVDDEGYDTVVSLSVADWNVDTDAIIEACWHKVAPGGRLVISARLTDLEGTRDFSKSYQYILPGDQDEVPEDVSGLEKAPYVVLNVRESLGLFAALKPTPADILAYGYWGAPSKTAMTPYQRLVFAVLSITKASKDEASAGEPVIECHFPAGILG